MVVLHEMTKIPLELLDHRHQKISPRVKHDILDAKFNKVLIADGLEHGFFKINDFGEIDIVCTRQSLPSIKGFIFEVATVRYINENITTIGKKIFDWCTNKLRSSTDEYIQKYKAIGTGFISTQNTYPSLYEPHSNTDIRFIKECQSLDNGWEFALISGNNIPAGIQIKAITSNEINQIIKPLLSGKYTHVLTFLCGNNGIHTYINCMDEIRRMSLSGEITLEQKDFLEARICSPEHFGIRQYDVDDYSEYINFWYERRAKTETNDLIEAVGFEVAGYKYNESGILIPN